MIIEAMQIDDLEQVMVIENENFSVPWTETGFFTFLLREDACFLVAREGEEILGYMGVLHVLDEGDITNVSVAKTHRRRGVGRALVEAMLEAMAEIGVTTLHLEVRESNAPAIALYKGLGFEEDGLRKGYYEQPTEDAILMSRTRA